MADVRFGHRTGHTPPATMDRPDQWRYVATRLMAHMGAYSPDEMNGLHWRWHQHAALRIQAAMQDHNIWNIPGSPGHEGHAPGHRQPRSQVVPEPPTQAARRNSPELPEAGSDPRGHLWVTWGVYLCAGKPLLADIILSHPPDLIRCDSVIGLAIPAMSGHIQYRGAAS